MSPSTPGRSRSSATRSPGARSLGARSLGAAALALVALAAGCSDDDTSSTTIAAATSVPAATDATSDTTTDATSDSTATTAGEPDTTVDPDDAAIVISATATGATDDEMAQVASATEQRLASLGIDGTATVDGTDLTIAIGDSGGLTGDDLVQLLTRSGQLLLRPALECLDQAGAAATGVERGPTDPEATITLPLGRTGECTVGPAAATGEVFEPGAAEAVMLPDDAWGVALLLREGADGLDIWNELATRCFLGDATCPTSRLAIEVDGLILAAPLLSSGEFGREVQLSGTFTEVDVTALALALNAGVLPVALEVTDVAER